MKRELRVPSPTQTPGLDSAKTGCKKKFSQSSDVKQATAREGIRDSKRLMGYNRDLSELEGALLFRN
jgi:hypothetical protein